MTNVELLDKCIESDEFGSDGFLVIIPLLFYTKYVTLDKDLRAKNLGRYPKEIGGSDYTTHLWLECSTVRKYLAKLK